MTIQPILINGQWREARAVRTYQAVDPSTKQTLPAQFPVSAWEDVDEALDVAVRAAAALERAPAERVAGFLDRYAGYIESATPSFIDMAHLETALPKKPRLADRELPRTMDQLRQAAAAARNGSWAMPTIDTKRNIRACYLPMGPVCVFGPNNFPFAFNSVSGGDFVAAVASGNPVIAIAHYLHPATIALFAEQAQRAAETAGLPDGTIQLLFGLPHEDGVRFVSDQRIGASTFTGKRSSGLALREAAHQAGKPFYMETGSINPVVLLPGALTERHDAIVEDFARSCLLGTGQFCTNPGLVIVVGGPEAEQFLTGVATRFQSVPVGPLLSEGVRRSLEAGVTTLRAAGAEVVTGGVSVDGPGYHFANTLLRVPGECFLANPTALQTECFGPVSLVVVAKDLFEFANVIDALEGNLTGAIYSDTAGKEEVLYDHIAQLLRRHVGRFLDDQMPTGVEVSPGMHHGGPYPATAHSGFTSVGIPFALLRFARRQCFDHVREHRLPWLLRDKNPTGKTWRFIDGTWTQGDVVRS